MEETKEEEHDEDCLCEDCKLEMILENLPEDYWQ